MCFRVEQFFPNRRPPQVEFYNTSRPKHDVWTKRLHIVLKTEFCWTMLRSSKYVLANCFQIPSSEEMSKVVLHVAVHLSKYFCSQIDCLVPSLPLSSRIVRTNSPLLRKYWADVQDELFGTRVVFDESPLKWTVSKPFFLFKIPPLKSTGAFKNTRRPVSLNRCTISLAVESHSPLGRWEDPPYHFFSDPGPGNVQCPCKNLFA